VALQLAGHFSFSAISIIPHIRVLLAVLNKPRHCGKLLTLLSKNTQCLADWNG